MFSEPRTIPRWRPDVTDMSELERSAVLGNQKTLWIILKRTGKTVMRKYCRGRFELRKGRDLFLRRSRK